MFDAFLNASHKAHELGAGHLMLKEAGGFLTDWEGRSLDDVPYDFDATYKIIAAATPELGQLLLSSLDK